jgi:hypothetical protein
LPLLNDGSCNDDDNDNDEDNDVDDKRDADEVDRQSVRAGSRSSP